MGLVLKLSLRDQVAKAIKDACVGPLSIIKAEVFDWGIAADAALAQQAQPDFTCTSTPCGLVAPKETTEPSPFENHGVGCIGYFHGCTHPSHSA